MELHRNYKKDSWKRNGKKPESIDVPGFLPDDEEIRGDLLYYTVEIDWFNLHLTRILNYLDSIGELDNTILIVTGDNGMPFFRAKANSFEYGVHVPLAISYLKGFPGNRIVNDPVSFVDFAPTIREMTNTKPEEMMPIFGRSITDILKSEESGILDETRKNIDDKITWDVELLSEGDYEVEVYYTCPEKDAGATLWCNFHDLPVGSEYRF